MFRNCGFSGSAVTMLFCFVRGWRPRWRRTEALVNGKFLLCLFLVPGSLQRGGKGVMHFGISRHEALRSPQGGDCLFIPLECDERESPAQVGLRKVRIQLCRLRKAGDRLVPLLFTASKFSQDIYRARIARIELQFLEELLLRAFGRVLWGIRSRKQQSAQQEVNAAG